MDTTGGASYEFELMELQEPAVRDVYQTAAPPAVKVKFSVSSCLIIGFEISKVL
jgi:hypothetical protein